MPIRNIIRIDEDKCNGCGQCVVDCEEGALAIIDGKAKLVKESYCDGLGACIGGCPTDALTIEQREAPEFEMPEHMAGASAPVQANAAFEPQQNTSPASCPSSGGAPGGPDTGGCPGARSYQFQRPAQPPTEANPPSEPENFSALTHWPIQMHLVNFRAPHFQGQEVLIAADCSAFACGAFHARLLSGRAVVIGCPKLDDPTGYLEKLTEMFTHGQPPKVIVARMEVPCCRGITQWVLSARQNAGSTTPVEEVILGIEGVIISRRTL